MTHSSTSLPMSPATSQLPLEMTGSLHLTQQATWLLCCYHKVRCTTCHSAVATCHSAVATCHSAVTSCHSAVASCHSAVTSCYSVVTSCCHLLLSWNQLLLCCYQLLLCCYQLCSLEGNPDMQNWLFFVTPLFEGQSSFGCFERE